LKRGWRQAYDNAGIDGEGADYVAGFDEIDGQEGADDVGEEILTVSDGWRALFDLKRAKEVR
jgi:hypothetical protein